MSLTKQDLTDIRNVVLEALDFAVNPRLDAIESRLDKLETRLDKLESEFHGFRAEMTSFKTTTNARLSAIESQLTDINGRLTAVENDIKEIYTMLGQNPITDFASKKYQKLSERQKILVLDKEVTTLANHMKVPLPRPH